MFHKIRSAVFVLSVFCFAGCDSQEKLASVSGSVTVGGKPASGAIIMFLPDATPDLKTTPATATAKEDGTFSMSTGTAGGVKPGKYVVTVKWPDPKVKITDAQKMMGATASDAPDLLKGRYDSREKSQIKVEIKSGENKLEPFVLN